MKNPDELYVETRIIGELLPGSWKISQIAPWPAGIWRAIVQNSDEHRIVHFRVAQTIKVGDEVEVFQHPLEKNFFVAIKKERTP